MSDSIFNRPRRQEPRVSDERSRDFRDHGPDQGAERRDPGADAMSELARMIAGTDPIPGHSDAGHKSGGRLADVTRNTISSAPQSFEGRSSLDRGARREPDFGSGDFLQLPDRDDYAVAPQHAMTDEDHYHGEEQRHSGYGRQDEEYADEYHDDQYGQDGDDEYGDDSGHREPRVKRRTGKMAFAILLLAVFGGAAAFGYRTVFKAAPSGPTPIIHADNSPTKVAPAATEASAKPASGPFGDREQLVRRDEEPVDVGAKYGATADSGVAGSSPPDIVPATAPTPNPPPAVTSGDPKRVRTVRIGAEQGPAPSDRTPSRSVPPPPQSQPAAPPPQRQAAAAPPPQRQAAAVPPPPYIPPAVEEGRAKGPAPVAAAPDAPAAHATDAGGFVVQLSAQRSEAEAQTAFRALQTKYSMLSGHELVVRRKDLGDRGIFFAAQVGPFGAKGDADQLCESLKAAGGACFVQKN